MSQDGRDHERATRVGPAPATTWEEAMADDGAPPRTSGRADAVRLAVLLLVSTGAGAAFLLALWSGANVLRRRRPRPGR